MKWLKDFTTSLLNSVLTHLRKHGHHICHIYTYKLDIFRTRHFCQWISFEYYGKECKRPKCHCALVRSKGVHKRTFTIGTMIRLSLCKQRKHHLYCAAPVICKTLTLCLPLQAPTTQLQTIQHSCSICMEVWRAMDSQYDKTLKNY